MIDWPTVETSIGASALTATLAGWLLSTFLLHRLERVNQQAAVRFSTLHEKRAEILAELYRRLSNIDIVIRGLPAKEQPIDVTEHQQKVDFVLEEMKQAGIYFRNHALYFEPVLKDKSNRYLQGTWVFWGMTSLIADTVGQSAQVSEERKQKVTNTLLPAVVDAHRQVGPLLADIEQEFRKLLEA